MEREVILDGEAVDFQGPCPESAESVWEVLENHLGSCGRLIRACSIDGREWRIEEGGGGDFRRMEFVSSSQAAEFRDALRSILESREGVLDAWRQVAVGSLSMDRSGSFAAGSAALEATRGVIEFCGLAVGWGKTLEADWAAALEKGYESLNVCLSGWMDALERFDPVLLSDRAAWDVKPGLDSLYLVFEESVFADLNRRAGE